jgi:hypothetical protein
MRFVPEKQNPESRRKERPKEGGSRACIYSGFWILAPEFCFSIWLLASGFCSQIALLDKLKKRPLECLFRFNHRKMNVPHCAFLREEEKWQSTRRSARAS